MILTREHEWQVPIEQHRSGLWIPAREKRPTCVDLFCGAGGFSLGMITGGFEVLAGVDNDVEAATTYCVNLATHPMTFHFIEPEDKERMEKHLQKGWKKRGIARMPASGTGWKASNPEEPGIPHFFLGDIRKLTGERVLDAIGLEVGELDCVVGGPPCQGFSRAGRQDVMDPRNSYVFDFARLVVEMRPKTLVFENVPAILDMITPEGIPVVDAFCRILEDGDYAGHEALRRSMMGRDGAKAAMRGSKSSPERRAAMNEAAEAAAIPPAPLFEGLEGWT